MMDELQTLTIEQTGSNVKITGKSRARARADIPSSDSSAEKNAAPEGESQRTTTSQQMSKWPASRRNAEPARQIHSHIQPVSRRQAIVCDHKDGK